MSRQCGWGKLCGWCLCYLVTSHEAQVSQRLAALCYLRSSLVGDVLTPAGVHRLYGAAVLADGYQSCGHGRVDKGGGEKREKQDKKGVSPTAFSCKCGSIALPQRLTGIRDETGTRCEASCDT